MPAVIAATIRKVAQTIRRDRETLRAPIDLAARERGLSRFVDQMTGDRWLIGPTQGPQERELGRIVVDDAPQVLAARLIQCLQRLQYLDRQPFGLANPIGVQL